MSGPKVVRIVSAQEYARMEAQRDRMLDELKEAIALWNKCLTELAQAPGAERVSKLEQRISFIKANFFPDFGKSMQKVREEVKLLQKDIEEARLQKRARELAQRRSLESAGRTIANGLVRSGQKVPDELRAAIDKIHKCSPEELTKCKMAINDAARSVLKAEEDKGARSEATNLAKELAVGLSVVEKLSTMPLRENSIVNAKSERIDRFVAEIELLGNIEEAQLFIERARSIENEQLPQRRELLMDSLILDLADRCNQQRERHRVASMLQDARKDLVQLDEACLQSVIEQIDNAIASGIERKKAESLVDEAREQARMVVSKRYSQEKRRAILNSLAMLGYDVKEGMETLWTRNGKLVLAKKETPTVGIELGAGDSVERMQMRAVTIIDSAGRRDPRSDTAIETQWCGEIDQLKKAVQAAGHQFVIEQAQPIGKVPLKSCQAMSWIENAEDEEEEMQEKPKLQRQELR